MPCGVVFASPGFQTSLWPLGPSSNRTEAREVASTGALVGVKSRQPYKGLA